MTILYVLVPLGLVLCLVAVWAFFWAVNTGQFEELDAASGTFPHVEGDSFMPLLIALAAAVVLMLVDASRTKPGDPL